MRNKSLLVLLALALYSLQVQAQHFKAGLTADGGDIVISLRAEGGDLTTDFSQVEFYIRTTDLTTAFTSSITLNTTNFPTVPTIADQGVVAGEAGYRTWWFASQNTPNATTNTYLDGVEYELARITFTGTPDNNPNNSAVFELVSDAATFASYLSIIDAGGNSIDGWSCLGGCPGGDSFFYGDAVAGSGFGVSSESSVAPVPLPVELSNFTGWAETKTNVLKWVTQSEENSSSFEVERSTDSENFVRVGVVNAAGNSAEEITYGFTDENPAQGLNYYRLKMVDLDGTYEYSNIIQIKRTGSSTIKAFPNPFTKSVSLQVAALESGQAQFSVFDITGQQVMNREIAIQSGVSNIELGLDALAEGTYIVKALLPGSEVLTTKIIKKN